MVTQPRQRQLLCPRKAPLQPKHLPIPCRGTKDRVSDSKPLPHFSRTGDGVRHEAHPSSAPAPFCNRRAPEQCSGALLGGPPRTSASTTSTAKHARANVQRKILPHQPKLEHLDLDSGATTTGCGVTASLRKRRAITRSGATTTGCGVTASLRKRRAITRSGSPSPAGN